MRPSLALTVALLILAGSGFYCKRSHEHPGQLVGKLVLNGPCGRYVVQVISGNAASRQVAPVWKDPQSGNTYYNVFEVRDYCYFGQSGLKQNELFHFSFTDSTVVNPCAICEIATTAPPAANTIIDIQPIQ